VIVKEPIVDFGLFDVNQVVHDKAYVESMNPHRYELSLLHGILFEDLEGFRIVGYHDASPNDFWVRGHFPGFPVMPGVLICEAAAQLCAFMANRTGILVDRLIGLGGLEEVRFRAPVRPGDRLVMMLKKDKSRHNVMLQVTFECYVQQEKVAEGIIKGVTMPVNTKIEVTTTA
jgi:3-hydroxyacyl-[acyl-carrier-protein] dehydratase